MPAEPAAEAPEERRLDPETGKQRTLKQMYLDYQGKYSPRQITEYWQIYCKKTEGVTKGTLKVWRVVGGSDKGGIVVRSGKDLKTQELQRLSTGAKIEEIERDGDRMQFRKISGVGPNWGWVSTTVKGKEMLEAAW